MPEQFLEGNAGVRRILRLKAMARYEVGIAHRKSVTGIEEKELVLFLNGCHEGLQFGFHGGLCCRWTQQHDHVVFRQAQASQSF